MAQFTDRIRLIFDADSTPAVKSFKSLRQSVGEAEGAFGKLRAAGASIMSGLNRQAGLFAAGAGAALISWAIKGAAKFENLAKTAIDLGKATGLTTEQASRWVAVADDAAVSADTLQASLGRIPKTLDSGAWERYGIATHNADGSIRSTNEILLDALDTLSRTTSETQRATIGSALFGKAYAGLAPLVGQTRAEYEKMLGTVSDGQVITDSEAAKAEKLRKAQDDLSDALRDVQIALGEVVTAGAPVITTFANLLPIVTDGLAALSGNDAKSISGPLQDYANAAEAAGEQTFLLADNFDTLRVDAWNALGVIDKIRHRGLRPDWLGGKDQWWMTKRTFDDIMASSPAAAKATLDLFNTWVSGSERGSASMKRAAAEYGLTRARLDELTAAYEANGSAQLYEAQIQAQADEEAARRTLAMAAARDAAARAADELANHLSRNLEVAERRVRHEWELLLGALSQENAFGDAMLAVDGLAQRLQDLQTQHNEGTITDVQYWVGTTQAINDTKTAVDDVLQAMNAPADLGAQYHVWIDQGEYDLVLRRLQILQEAATGMKSSAWFGDTPVAGVQPRAIQRRAAGGPASGLTLVGEQGPELVNLPGGSNVINNTNTMALLGGASSSGATNVNISVSVPPTANPAETGRVVADALAAFYRQGGQRP